MPAGPADAAARAGSNGGEGGGRWGGLGGGDGAPPTPGYDTGGGQFLSSLLLSFGTNIFSHFLPATFLDDQDDIGHAHEHGYMHRSR